MGNKKNIIVGAAEVFLGPALTDSSPAGITAWRPAVSGTTPYGTTVAATAGWRNVGYTQDGLEVATDPSWGEVEVDQLLDAAKIFKDGMSLNISTTMAEATLENLLIAWGQTESIASTANDREIQMEAGALGQAPLERGLIAVGNGVEKTASNVYTERTYFAYRVLSVEASTHSLARAEATTVPVTFRALPADNGRYGAVRDRLNVV